MIWIEKYRPTMLEDAAGKEGIADMLRSYSLETIPHLIIHGQPGHGKKTVLLGLVRHLFGEVPRMRVRNTEIQSGSRKIDVTYLESDEYVEICPSDHGYQDKAVIQSVIKEMGQTKPILSMFARSKRPSIKLIVITSAEDLSSEAQAALRRTIEMYSGSFRIVLMCNELSRLIEPIRSRCLFVRIPGFSDEEVMRNMQNVLGKENCSVPDDALREICRHSAGNMRRALCALELLCFNQNERDVKRARVEKTPRLEWECMVDSIVSSAKARQTSESLMGIRKDLYVLLNSCISPRTLLVELLRGLVQGADFATLLAISQHALVYEERMRLGTKSIYHLEAFVAASMCIFGDKRGR